jgi:hypothetical protein
MVGTDFKIFLTLQATAATRTSGARTLGFARIGDVSVGHSA